jgi:hypothetical protein
MRGTGIENEVEICATNPTNKTKCMNTNAKKWKKSGKNLVYTKRIYSSGYSSIIHQSVLWLFQNIYSLEVFDKGLSSLVGVAVRC